MGIFAYFLALAALIFGPFVLTAYECEAQYSAYGITSYGPIQGCMIETKDGKHIPSVAIREFDN
jgi:hypothetical protein